MIHNFNFENFYSFKERNKISFLVSEKAPRNTFYFKNDGNRANKILGVFGPNGSGKSNVLQVLPFLSWFIKNSFSLQPEDKIPVKYFTLSNYDEKTPIKIGVTFETEEKVYSYNLVINAERVLKEELKHKTSSGFRLLFLREFNPNTKKYEFDLKNYNFKSDFVLALNERENASLFTTAIRLGHEESKKIVSYWDNIYPINFQSPLNKAQPDIFSVSKFYNENKDLKKEVDSILQKLDLGLSGISIQEVSTEKGETVFFPFGEHITREGKNKSIPFYAESDGTQNLYILLKDIYTAFNTGGVAIFDEIETGLHPKIVLYILKLFLNPEINKKNTQLFFSSHSLLVLEELDKYQIQFIEKNKYGESKTWRLDDQKGVRLDDNYLAKYLKGVYKALPNLQD